MCVCCVLCIILVFPLLFILQAHVNLFIMVFSVIVNDDISNILLFYIVRIRTVPIPNTDTQNVLQKFSSIKVRVS